MMYVVYDGDVMGMYGVRCVYIYAHIYIPHRAANIPQILSVANIAHTHSITKHTYASTSAMNTKLSRDEEKFPTIAPV